MPAMTSLYPLKNCPAGKSAHGSVPGNSWTAARTILLISCNTSAFRPWKKITKGDANLDGQIELGEGTYHVDWLMRDRGEHVCSFYWDMDASLASKDKQMELAIAANHVDGPQFEQFKEEPPVARSNPPLP